MSSVFFTLQVTMPAPYQGQLKGMHHTSLICRKESCSPVVLTRTVCLKLYSVQVAAAAAQAVLGGEVSAVLVPKESRTMVALRLQLVVQLMPHQHGHKSAQATLAGTVL